MRGIQKFVSFGDTEYKNSPILYLKKKKNMRGVQKFVNFGT